MPECPTCSKELDTYNGLTTHHSIVHGESINVYKDVECEICGNIFEVKPSHVDKRRFCSQKCKSVWQSKNINGENHPNWSRKEVKCSNCGEEFKKKSSRIERSEEHFCSESCRKDWWSEYCKNIDYSGSEHHSWSGGITEVNCNYCGEAFDVYPKRDEKYEKSFCSRECYGNWLSENIQGENHPRYKENSMDQINYRGGWKRASEKARQRDGGCVYCGMDIEEHKAKYGFKPHVHHKQRYKSFEDPYEANQLENLITLCCEHHKQVEEGLIEVEEL